MQEWICRPNRQSSNRHCFCFVVSCDVCLQSDKWSCHLCIGCEESCLSNNIPCFGSRCDFQIRKRTSIGRSKIQSSESTILGLYIFCCKHIKSHFNTYTITCKALYMLGFLLYHWFPYSSFECKPETNDL